MSIEYIRKDENLLKITKKIFGDELVDDAFHCYPYSDKDLADKGMVGDVAQSDNRIELSSEEIAIVFCNGKTVHFSVSEWGDISFYGDTLEYIEI